MTSVDQQFPRASRRDLLAQVLVAHFGDGIGIVDAPGKALPFDPDTLDALGISVSEYAGTSMAIAQFLGIEAGDASDRLDLIATVLEVTR
ncbi:hypothetical protein [Tsukamurella tyrosinosolvens]|uniref:hypothetical protein n=1 Tax=Tsukamurella tyrosinosolvens TaxID=57704 RepID=UPI000DF6B8D3|nr:hypothetical protein [Tsukamurella tyrosinosolvens]RDB49353.1 hypothetical protein DVB87_03220 [Tsukamurella tyrosinosolvens]